MSWAGVISTLDAILTAAGAAATPTMGVVHGDPIDEIPSPTIAYWYSGDRESTTGGNTLALTHDEEQITIRCYWPLGDPSRSGDLEVIVRETKEAITDGLWGNAHLSGNAIGIKVENATAGYSGRSDAADRLLYRTLTVPIWIDLAGTTPIVA